MIGKTLWTEFFTNRDWPLASAVAVALLLILVIPIVVYREPRRIGSRRAAMRRRFSWFNAIALTFGFAFLYLPILILVVYSFNASRLVTVWGGFSTNGMPRLLRNEAVLRRGLGDAPRRLRLGDPGDGARHARRASRWCAIGRFRGRTLFSGMIYAPLVMPEVITGLSLLLLFVALGLDRGFWTVILAHITFTMCFVTVVVQSRLVTFDRALEEAALDLGARRRRPSSSVTLPLIAPGGRGGVPARLHALARRPRDRELHLRPGRDDAADADLQPGPARRHARRSTPPRP